MALIGNDFQPHMMQYTGHCSECSEKLPVGTMALASIKDGKVKKIVCSEACRQEFDARFWDEAAKRNRRK
jgi:hypothetical protein